ncbi:hypothetical protein EVAR_41518_1 [Eumeta japonica]|uniref:Uncharacterized protein n=1 Tax=Eumeta variegata TaxID=151549 RepID=A0A4C1X659_EUMVA|nr:hypothetical protein EVAR_41518_1 [Eumeta japonica]
MFVGSGVVRSRSGIVVETYELTNVMDIANHVTRRCNTPRSQCGLKLLRVVRNELCYSSCIELQLNAHVYKRISGKVNVEVSEENERIITAAEMRSLHNTSAVSQKDKCV